MSPPILDQRFQDLLRAALAEGPEAAASYRAWRGGIALDDIDFTAFRILPLLVATITRYDIDEPDIARIKGASKQTWLDNMMRARLLMNVVDVLSDAGIDVVVIKGAALLARYPHLATMRGAGDYDLLVRRAHAGRATDALLGAGFRAEGFSADRFAGSDFDLIHAMAFTRDDPRNTIDVHWWPLPDWFDRDYVDELFRRAEQADLIGRAILVPSLDDHLLLATKRITFDDQDEILLRSVEVALLLRGCAGQLDWDRFLSLAQTHHSAAHAFGILDLVKSAVHAPVPDEIIARLRLDAQQDEKTEGALPDRDDADLADRWREHSARAIDFAERPVAYLEGFSFPEDQGRWTDGTFAAMAVRVDGASKPIVRIRLELLPHLPSAVKRFGFEIYGGCGAVRPIVWTAAKWKPSRRSVVISAQVQGGADSMAVVVFKFDNACSPKSIGLSEDTRRLGLMIKKVSWY